MKNLKRSLSLLLVVMLIAATLTSCSSSKGKASSNKESGQLLKELKVTQFNGGWGYMQPDRDKVGSELEKKLGYKVTMDQVLSDDAGKKLQLWAATDMAEWPDILMPPADPASQALIKRLGDAGKLMNLDTVLSKMPDAEKVLKQPIDLIRQQNGGKLYGIPQNYNDRFGQTCTGGTDYCSNVVSLRKDWMTQLSLQFPKNVDELEKILYTFKDKIKLPNSLSVIAGFVPQSDLPGFAGTYTCSFAVQPSNVGNNGWIFKNGQAINNVYENPKYMIADLTRFNKWYHDGLVPTDIFTTKNTQGDESANLGRVGALGTSLNWTTDSTTATIQKTTPNAYYVGTQPLYDAKLVDKAEKPLATMTMWSTWVVRSDISKDKLNTFIDFYNKSADKDTYLLLKYGVKDVQWQYNSEKKIEDTKDVADKLKGDWNERAKDGIESYLPWPNYKLQTEVQATTAQEKRDDYKETWKNLGFEYAPGYYSDPNYYIVPGPAELRNTVGDKERRQKLLVDCITGDASKIEGLVNDWVKTEKSLGYEEIKTERTAACKAFKTDFLK